MRDCNVLQVLVDCAGHEAQIQEPCKSMTRVHWSVCATWFPTRAVDSCMRTMRVSAVQNCAATAGQQRCKVSLILLLYARHCLVERGHILRPVRVYGLPCRNLILNCIFHLHESCVLSPLHAYANSSTLSDTGGIAYFAALHRSAAHRG